MPHACSSWFGPTVAGSSQTAFTNAPGNKQGNTRFLIDGTGRFVAQGIGREVNRDCLTLHGSWYGKIFKISDGHGVGASEYIAANDGIDATHYLRMSPTGDRIVINLIAGAGSSNLIERNDLTKMALDWTVGNYLIVVKQYLCK